MTLDLYSIPNLKGVEVRHREMVESARLEQLIREAKGQKPKLWQKLTCVG